MWQLSIDQTTLLYNMHYVRSLCKDSKCSNCVWLFVSLCSDEEEAGGLEILMEAPEGFRNSDEDRFSESQVISRLKSL